MKKKENLALWLSIISLAFSSYAALSCDKRIEADWMGVLVGILALLVTVLLGWNIYSAIHIEETINKKIDSSITEAQKKAERNIQIALATTQIRAINGYIANQDWYMVMNGYSTCIWDILQLQDKNMAGDIIPLIENILERITIREEKEIKALSDLIDNIKKLSSLDERAFDLYSKAIEKMPIKNA